jgi:hypothetical protein
MAEAFQTCQRRTKCGRVTDGNPEFMLEGVSSLPLGGTRRDEFVRSKEGNVPRVLRVLSTKGWSVAAVMLVLVACRWKALPPYTTTFSRRPMAGWRDSPAATRWVARDGAVRRTYVPRGYGEVVRRTAFGLHDDFVVAAIIRTSPGRTNAGVTMLFKDHANHMWGKIEISPGTPVDSCPSGTGSAAGPSRCSRGLQSGSDEVRPIVFVSPSIRCTSHRLDSERRTARVDRSNADPLGAAGPGRRFEGGPEVQDPVGRGRRREQVALVRRLPRMLATAVLARLREDRKLRDRTKRLGPAPCPRRAAFGRRGQG